jgi:hypothetical protein
MTSSHARLDLHDRLRRDWWTTLLVAAILGWGLFSAVVTRNQIFSDGISYLEIADDYLSGNWRQAVNSYWSPLYSWLLAGAKAALVFFPLSERTVLHLLNFVIFSASLAAFQYFVHRLALRLDVRLTRTVKSVVYLTFSWATEGLIGTWRPMPDLLIALIAFAACGLILHVRSDGSGRKALGLGAVLGLGYLAKTAFLPVAAVFIVGMWKTRRATLVAAGMLVVVSPWVTVLSLHEGRLTIGSSGAINYAWEVNGARRWTHWNGEPGAKGRPVHPTRRLNEVPEVYEFAGPIAGTYPPWRDPSYWHEGMSVRIDLGRQARAIWYNGRFALTLLVLCPAFVGAIPAALRFRESLRAAGRIWFVMLPSAWAIILYSLVFVESRYIAPFLTVLGVSAFLAGAAIESSWQTRLAGRTAALISAVCFNAVSVSVYGTLLAQGLLKDRHVGLARQASRYSIQRGSKVGYIGHSLNAYWIRLAGARIVSEVPVVFARDGSVSREMVEDKREVYSFWRGTAETREMVLRLMRGAGADAVVADVVPPWARTDGWHELRVDTPRTSQDDRVFVYPLDRRGVD